GGVGQDEQRGRETGAEGLARLKGLVRDTGTVTAGNSTGLNDGACAVILASEEAAERYPLTPRARIVSAAVAGVQPRVMGIGPLLASRRALARAGLEIGAMDTIEVNEAFAAQVLAVLRGLGCPTTRRMSIPTAEALRWGTLSGPAALDSSRPRCTS